MRVGARGRGRCGGRARVLILFPMELSNQSDSSETEDNENLIESYHSTPSKHSHSSNLYNSGMRDGNDHDSDLDDKVKVPHQDWT